MLLRSIFIALVSASLAFAQAADTRDLDAYSAAINTPGLARAAALQRYLATFQGGALHIDALEWLTWTQLQSRDATAAQPGAAALQAADTNNALASAVMLLAAARAAKPTSSPTVMDAARRALDAVPHMHRPEGMADAEFANMRRTVAGMLDGAAGLTAWRAHKFDDARVYLKYALSVFPRDPAYAYALGIADLDGKNSNSSEGYWYLARAVNLSHSSQVAEYASQRYFADGGTPVDWSRFVQATALDGAPYVPPPQVRQASLPRRQRMSAPPLPPNRTAALDLPPIGVPPEQRAVRAGEPVSLGILIETSLTKKPDRDAVLYTLVDMLRRLGRNDEAFVLSYSDDMVFQQDLTGDPGALENALQHIQPQSGHALLQAIGFAAGHMQRIARNRNRVLLVISDGHNSGEKVMSALQAEGQIDESSVRIDCIGVRVDDTAARARLQALADRTGGQTAFVTSPAEFRGAARGIARSIGLEFPM